MFRVEHKCDFAIKKARLANGSRVTGTLLDSAQGQAHETLVPPSLLFYFSTNFLSIPTTPGQPSL